MKHFKFILPLIFILFSCTTDSVESPENTQLELTVKDENNIPVENSEIKLYATQNDSDNGTNVVQTLTTNANGKVIFENLQPITYYWRTSKQCYVYVEDNSINPIVANTLNTFSTLQATNYVGNINIVNNTSVEYSFTLSDGTNITTHNILPGGQVILDNSTSGNYTYSYTQVGGSTTTTSSFVLDCSGFENIVIN